MHQSLFTFSTLFPKVKRSGPGLAKCWSLSHSLLFNEVKMNMGLCSLARQEPWEHLEDPGTSQL